MLIVEALESLHPDLVLMDLLMPHANGVELLSWLERGTHHHAEARWFESDRSHQNSAKKSLLIIGLAASRFACDAAIDGAEQA